MIRIVGVQRSQDPSKEFVLLQNQGSLRVSLRGHVVLSEEAIQKADCATTAHIFREDELVPPGMYVLLSTGDGTPRWAKTKEGSLIYYAYMKRDQALWVNDDIPLHILATQHSYVTRKDSLLLMR